MSVGVAVASGFETDGEVGARPLALGLASALVQADTATAAEMSAITSAVPRVRFTRPLCADIQSLPFPDTDQVSPKTLGGSVNWPTTNVGGDEATAKG
jgi:hypothetical protein